MRCSLLYSALDWPGFHQWSCTGLTNTILQSGQRRSMTTLPDYQSLFMSWLTFTMSFLKFCAREPRCGPNLSIACLLLLVQIDNLLESGVNMNQCKGCKKYFGTDQWAEHQEKKADCSAEGFIVEETLIFCNKESHKFDVDESSSAAANAKAKNYLYLADNHAKDLYP